MVIAISGMIGSGKSTLSKQLNQHYHKSYLLEEFAQDDDVFNTFLKWVYEKEPNIDIAFQSYIIESLSDTFTKKEKLFLKDRNHKEHYMFLDRFNLEHYIFALVTLEKKPYRYTQAFNALFEHIINLDDNPDLAIFLDADFDTIKSRILSRGRKIEIDNFEINEYYFKRLHSLYKELFLFLVNKYNIPYYIINTNDINDEKVLNQTIDFIDKYDFTKSVRYK
ncbi:deoxynucleoside kinase [Mycoplasmopsis felis]|uniref:deoxynucleoside kinase n=1 Tax=Mycoplasmopsis felis TaxID=33923 RepID=UPI002DD42F29|nr:deoxynucleoside kinase [Mycoplasmopsis felis]WRX06523.1 deoxynucleoside kinase [Mycoplasmopsis felis]